jgi:hypothetical protein
MGWPGEALLIKLWETLAEKGVGSLLKPWQMRREGLASIELRRAEMLALAAAEKEAEEIRSGKKIVPVAEEIRQRIEPVLGEILVDRVMSARVIADAVRQEVNVAKAITHAEQELKDDPQAAPKEEVDPDWLYRWRDYAGNVSTDELQALWGRVLAGEVKSPGRYSYRTLEFVRNLSVREKHGVNFGFLLRMQGLGLLTGVDSFGLNVTYKSAVTGRFAKPLSSHGRALLVKNADPEKRLQLEIYGVTDLGTQVLSLGNFEPHLPYLLAIGEEIQRKGFEVSLCRCRSADSTQVVVFDEQPLDSQRSVQPDRA